MNGPRPYGPRRPLPVDPAVAALPEELQRLLRIVAMAANEAPSTREALRSCLDSVCRFTGWPLGHAFVREDRGNEYFSAGVWHVEPGEGFAHFRRISTDAVLHLGEGVVGRVAESVEPVVVEAVSTSPDYARPDDGELQGFDAAFIPLVTGGEPAGVLEFYFRPEDRPDGPILDVLTMIGRQLGRVVERDRAEQALRLSEALFAGIIGISSDAIVSIDAAQTIVTFNRGAETIFGYSAEEALGRPLDILIPERFRPTHRGHVEAFGAGPVAARRMGERG